MIKLNEKTFDHVQYEDEIVHDAFRILETRLTNAKDLMSESSVVRRYLSIKLAELEYESFGVLFLDIKNKLLADETLFHGTLQNCAVFPREVVKAALFHNAGNVILYHNHPSGDAFPSPADRDITDKLKQILQVVDVKVVDHIIIAGIKSFSFSESGFL